MQQHRQQQRRNKCRCPPPPSRMAVLHAIEIVAMREVPQVCSSLAAAGLPIAFISNHWMRHAFWGFLSIKELIAYAVLVATAGFEYQVYYLVTIFMHLESQIVSISPHTVSSLDLGEFLLNVEISEYRIKDYIEAMQMMRNRNGKDVTQVLQ
mmetsp:Transcript_8319/g.13471  ORF Transcript_8319/g.13471 Transcript_8319/m.13471 type:complete len:152 (+) Transcript_8319:265-720(+)